jgi:hypothetical protein
MLNGENLTYDSNPVSARSNNTNNGINNLASPAKNNVIPSNLKIENRIINSTTGKVNNNNNNNNGNNINNSAQPPENSTRSSFSRSVNTSGRRVMKVIDKKFDNTADPTNNNNNNSNSISGNKGALISKVQFKNESENSSKVTSFKSAQSNNNTSNNNNENSTSIHTPRSLVLKISWLNKQQF